MLKEDGDALKRKVLTMKHVTVTSRHQFALRSVKLFQSSHAAASGFEGTCGWLQLCMWGSFHLLDPRFVASFALSTCF